MSHHPPSVAHHAEGRGWTLWQNFTMSSKFRGKYLQVTPQGTAHCKFAKSGNHYTWKKVTTTVNNIIVGKLWIDQVRDFLLISLLILILSLPVPRGAGDNTDLLSNSNILKTLRVNFAFTERFSKSIQ